MLLSSLVGCCFLIDTEDRGNHTWCFVLDIEDTGDNLGPSLEANQGRNPQTENGKQLSSPVVCQYQYL